MYLLSTVYIFIFVLTEHNIQSGITFDAFNISIMNNYAINNPETDSCSDEEEIEPKLKYVRLTNEDTKNDIHDILSNDSFSCVAVHSKFLCFGTRSGAVYILDHLGNLVGINNEKSFQRHSVSVNQISVDKKGEFIASCSDDGIIIINGLYTADNNQKINTGQQVKSVALDPNLYKSLTKFIIGNKQMMMYERTLFKSLKPTVIGVSDGLVSNLAWNGQWVAWATHTDVKIYDLVEKNSIGIIKWDKPEKENLIDYRCNLKWSTPTTLIIGWLDTIRVCNIRKPNALETSTRIMPNFIMDIKATFQTDFYVSGLAPFETNQLVVLGFPKERNLSTNKALRPVLSVFQFSVSDNYTEICSDSLPIRGFQEYKCDDYHLECLMEENQYFIISPKDIIVANHYDRDDRVRWLIDHKKFDQAMEIIATEGGKYSLISVERQYIDYLLLHGHHDEAAKLCLRAFGNDKSLWEEEVYKFLKVHQLRSISAYIPRTTEHKLNAHVYEMILYEYLQFDPKGFLELIKEWNPNLYNNSSIINATHDHLSHINNNIMLLEALAILYTYAKQYENALTVYLKLQHKDVFNLIEKHNLYSVIHRMIVPLIKLDNDKALSILLNTNKISPDVVVQQLQQNPEYLYFYLDALDKIDHSQKYHEELVSLHAKFAPEKLLPFLKRSNNYPIQKALDICKKSLYYPEMVYILGRMGNLQEALAIIIKKLKNIEMAIEFCTEHDDMELWNILIDKSVDKPENMTKVLCGIIGYINPVILINKIKMGQKIPDLKKLLIKMLCDYNSQLTIIEGCNDVLATDYFKLHEKLTKHQRKGMCISDELSCEMCRRNIIIKGPLKTDIVAFNCRHVFHETCLPDRFTIDYCLVCVSKKRF